MCLRENYQLKPKIIPTPKKKKTENNVQTRIGKQKIRICVWESVVTLKVGWGEKKE